MVKSLPQRGAGFLVLAELKHLQPLLKGAPKPYLAILGGAKVSDKIKVIDQLLARVDALLIGGGMADTFLSPPGGPAGASRGGEGKIGGAESRLQKGAPPHAQ